MRFLIKARPLLLTGMLGTIWSPLVTSGSDVPWDFLFKARPIIREEGRSTPPPAPGTANDQSRKRPIQLFVSFSMGIEWLKALKARPWPKGTRWVFQGLPPGINLVEFSRQIQGLGPTPGDSLIVEIDPIAFQRLKIVDVPTRVDFTGAVVPTILVGATHPDLDGKKIPTVRVMEPPMDTLIRSQLQAFDWTALKQRLVQETKVQTAARKLPSAKVTRTLTSKPQVKTLNPLKGPHGHVLFPAHETYPLWSPILNEQRLLIVDGESSDRWDRILVELQGRKSRTTHLLVTDLDPKNRDAILQRLKERFGLMAKPLPKEYPERLGLQALPAIVELSRDGIQITEIGPPA